MEQLDPPAYKIASFELIDLPLIQYVAAKQKPMIMSTGMASLSEIEAAVETAQTSGATEIILLHCISGYPTPIDECNLHTITELANRFDVAVGLSDHSKGNVAAVTSVALGASFIEKHFILDDSIESPDAAFSITPQQLTELVESSHSAWQALGAVNFERTQSERENVKFRRSIYFVNALKKGQYVTANDVRRVRPGYGLAPKFYQDIIGMKLITNVEVGQPVTWEVLSR